MASGRDNGAISDTESGEKPVRERLQKAHITPGQKPNSTADHMPAEPDETGEEEIGEGQQIARKRSFEDVDPASSEGTKQPPRQHTRKRSRDGSAEEEELNNGQRRVSGERARNTEISKDVVETNGAAEAPRAVTPEPSGEKKTATAEEIASPKIKRSRLHSTTADATVALPDDKNISSPDVAADTLDTADPAASESKTKSSSKPGETTKIPPTSGFADSSAVSPFGALAGSKSPSAEPQQKPLTTFASSGFGALAGSSASGFGAIGKESGGFGTGGGFATKSKGTEKSSFGGALGQQLAFSAATGSGFGTGASGFGKLGSSTPQGFGSALGGGGFGALGGGGLKTFASGRPTVTFGKSPKPFGQTADDDDEEADDDGDDDKTGAKSPLATEGDEQDERFYAQSLETGEEDEMVEFSSRAKLYNFAPGPDGKKEWRERGLGTLRFNVKRVQDDDDDDSKPKARLLMRAEGSHRVMLNTPVTKDIKFGSASGEEPQGGLILFMGTIDGKAGLELLQVKMKQANALDLHALIVSLQAEM